MRRGACLGLILVAGGWAEGAWASEAVPSPGGFAAKLGDGGCRASQGCLYQRANEVLLLQALYLREKAKLVWVDFSKSGSISADLGPFCRTSGNTRDRDCLKSFLLLARKSLRQVRGAMVQNEDALIRLGNKSGASAEGAADRPEPGEPSPGPETGKAYELRLKSRVRAEEPLIPDLQLLQDDPLLSRVDALLKGAGQDPRQGALLDLEVQGWWDDYPKCPERDEFIVVEELERFPSNPTGEKLRRVKTNPDGSSVIDEKRFQAAQGQCAQLKASWVQRAGQFATPQAAQAASAAAAKRTVVRQDAVGETVVPTRLLGRPGQLSEDAFKLARQFVVDCVSNKSASCRSRAGQRAANVRANTVQLTEAAFESYDEELDVMLKAL